MGMWKDGCTNVLMGKIRSVTRRVHCEVVGFNLVSSCQSTYKYVPRELVRCLIATSRLKSPPCRVHSESGVASLRQLSISQSLKVS